MEVSTGELSVSGLIIQRVVNPVVWYNRDIYYSHLQFLSNGIIVKAMIHLSQT